MYYCAATPDPQIYVYKTPKNVLGKGKALLIDGTWTLNVSVFTH